MPQFNPADSLDLAARNHPERISLYYGEQSWTVAQAAVATRKLARLLVSRGVVAHDRVVLVARNSPYHMLLHVACARIGAIFVPISYRFAGPELQGLLEFTEPAVAIFDPESAAQFTGELAVARFVIDDDDFAPLPAGGVPGFAGLVASAETASAANSSAANSSAANSSAVNSSADNASSAITELAAEQLLQAGGAMLFTSGSTGRPKAVHLTHEQLWWGSQNFREGFEYSNHDVELVTVPLTHIGGFNGTTLDLFCHGGTVVVVREFSPAVVLAELARHRVNMMFGVPTIYAALLADPHFDDYDLSAFRAPLIGGAICPPALLERMEKHGLRPLNVWGMTEAAASGFMLSQDMLSQACGSIGLPFAHVRAKIIDSNGQEAEQGELAISGPNVIDHYWHDAGYTAESFDGPWLLTGDLARRDERGFVWIMGRIRYQINTGGEKVIPEEVASVIMQMPEVSDVAVVGVPDPRWGHAVAAALVVHAGHVQPTLAQVRDYVAGHIARFKAPQQLRFVDRLPTNTNGKVDVAQVQALFED